MTIDGTDVGCGAWAMEVWASRLFSTGSVVCSSTAQVYAQEYARKSHESGLCMIKSLALSLLGSTCERSRTKGPRIA